MKSYNLKKNYMLMIFVLRCLIKGEKNPNLAFFLPDVVVSRGAVRLPADSVVFVPLGVNPGAPVACKPLVVELPPAWGAEGLELTAWLVDDEDRV